ncbi:BZ3500_MvSof-1268-A1-R1_Chr2-1g04083 [Microbotryum saponariae]|uniref:BZ3500_MvSof-1268-A1-R1_Chr2-1g04083 protein n=1 Tax=Microbotryum saponariae TaxID=289078 RepID=A0A2X0MAD6_9BASI|nr:BZ3500_MvSof-1268-A1-R1_Chr2-1g04083 [Microbotryum saponariae]SCZ91070.1 BZ3501_MvSof-1269-A2-R1_Chr2-1g03739 [Microbotryum saponariae]
MSVIARWPTCWHPNFAPHSSVTCTTILCASLISTIDKTFNLPEVSNRSTHHSILVGPPRTPLSTCEDHLRHPHIRLPALSTATDHSNAITCCHISFLIESTGFIDAANSESVGNMLLDRRTFDRHPFALCDPPVDRPNRHTSAARSPFVRRHPVTTTCKVTIRSPLVMAALTASTVDLPPHSCSIALDSLSSSDLLTMNTNPTIDSFSTHLPRFPIDTLHLASS